MGSQIARNDAKFLCKSFFCWELMSYSDVAVVVVVAFSYAIGGDAESDESNNDANDDDGNNPAREGFVDWAFRSARFVVKKITLAAVGTTVPTAPTAPTVICAAH